MTIRDVVMRVVLRDPHIVNMMIEERLENVPKVEAEVEVGVMIEIVVGEVEIEVMKMIATTDRVGINSKDMVGIVLIIIGTILSHPP